LLLQVKRVDVARAAKHIEQDARLVASAAGSLLGRLAGEHGEPTGGGGRADAGEAEELAAGEGISDFEIWIVDCGHESNLRPSN
jgi:hypothetical protein